MSRTSKLTLAATSLFAVSTVLIVHIQQKMEKEVCTQLKEKELAHKHPQNSHLAAIFSFVATKLDQNR
jgi:hypothetical protein